MCDFVQFIVMLDGEAIIDSRCPGRRRKVFDVYVAMIFGYMYCNTHTALSKTSPRARDWFMQASILFNAVAIYDAVSLEVWGPKSPTIALMERRRIEFGAC